MKSQYFWQNLFGANVYFITDASHKQLTNFVQEKHGGQYKVFDLDRICENYIPDSFAAGKAFRATDIDGIIGNRFYLWLEPRWDNSQEWHGMLVHECTHLAAEILKYAGVTLTSSSEEVYAYLIQQLYLEFLNRHKITKLKKKDKKS